MLDVEKIMIINERMDRMLAMMFNAPINAGKRITSNIGWVRNQRHTKDKDVAHCDAA